MSSINIIDLNPTPLRTTTPGEKTWIEVGTSGTLSVPGNSTITFKSSKPSVASILGTTITGVGFGKAVLTALDSNKKVLTEWTLYVGSVLIAGADGASWQLFADGSVNGPLTSDSTDISQRMRKLEKENVLFADVGNQRVSDVSQLMVNTASPPVESPTAVTCYLLNLQSITIPPQSNNS